MDGTECRAARTARRRCLAAIVGAAGAAMVMLSAATVSAQPPTGAQSEPQAATPQPAGREGFVIQSANGDLRLQLGLLLHADGRFAPGDDGGVSNDSFVVRRARPSLRGRVGKYFEFFFNPDFGGGSVVVQDAYLDTIFSPAFRVRIGKTKHPFGFERFYSSGNLFAYERGLPSALAPNRDIGVQVLGDLQGGAISYFAGVMNGVADGGSVDNDTNDAKDVVGRLVARPFTRRKESPLRGLLLGLSASAGRHDGSSALPSFRTATLQQPFFGYSGGVADGVRTRYSPHASYYYKQFGALAEYAHSEGPIAKGGTREDLAHDAWQVAASFVLTGENATDASVGLRPRASFDPENGHFGALQLAGRYHQLTIDERAFALGFAAAGASRKAQAWTMAVNWHLTQNVKYVLAFERTVFDGDADGARRPEQALAFRTQLYF